MVSEQSFLGSTMVDPICELKNLVQTGGIKEYYEAFDRIQRNIALPEEFLISWFIAGLKVDTRREVQSIRPQSVSHAYAYGTMYEIAYPKGRPLVTKKSSSLPPPSLQSVPSQSFSSSTSLILQPSSNSFQEIQEIPSSDFFPSISYSVMQSPSKQPDSASFLGDRETEEEVISEFESISGDSGSSCGEMAISSQMGHATFNRSFYGQSDFEKDGEITKAGQCLELVKPKEKPGISIKKIFSINKREETLVMNGFPRIEPDQELVLEMDRQQHITVPQKNTQQSSEKKASVAYNVFDEISNMDTGSNNFGASANSEVEANCTIEASDESKSRDRNTLGKPPEALDRKSDCLCLYAAIAPIGIKGAYQVFDKTPKRGFRGSDSSMRLNKAPRFMGNWIFDPGECTNKLGFTTSRQQVGMPELYEGHCSEFKEDPCARVFVFDPGGFIVRGSVQKLQIIKVGDSNEAKKSIQPSIDAETSLVALYQMPFDHAMDNLVFDPGGGNQKRVPKEMREATVDEFMLEDRALGEPRGDIFLQPIISKFSYYNVRDDIKFKLAAMIRFANGISHKHDVIERSSFGSRSESTIVFDPGITKGLSDHSLSALCSFLELFVIRKLLLQQLLAFEVHFPLDRRMIWFIAWEF